MRTEPCVCGGVIVAPHESAIAFVVAQHNASLRHIKWRWLMGTAEGATAVIGERDLSVPDPSVPPSAVVVERAS